MAKKKNPRQLREEKKAANIKKWVENAKQKQEKIEVQSNSPVMPIRNTDQKKSNAKASGLKSALVLGDSVILTSFGKGNDAKLEHRINPDLTSNPLTDQTTLKNIQVPKGERITFRSRIEASSDNPLHTNHEAPPRKVGQDLLCLKERLEKHYFGKTFEDNIHIQIAYQIFDIEKIMALYANSIVFSLDNVLRKESDELSDDFVGIGHLRTTISYENFSSSTNPKVKKTYAEFQTFLRKKELLYFGNAFYNGNTKRSDKEIYQMIAMYSSLRQYCFHGDYTSDEDKLILGNWLYRLDEVLTDDFKDMLDQFYQEATERLDSDFLKTNTVNLQILCMIFDKESPDSIVKSYYDFLIRKSYKNIGFSIKKLRECMLEQSRLNKYKEDQYNSVRSKLYKLFDFIIWHYYRNRQDKVENMVAALRSCRTDDEKEQYYIRESADVTEQLWYDLEEAASNVNGKNLQNLKNNNKNYHTELGNIRISSCPVSYFSKLIYLMTMVLDGKEINDLLTTLINKFENIVSFEATLRQLDQESQFVDDYRFFNYENCSKISGELRIINSFARMQKPSANAKKVMYRDALRILGMESEKSDEDLDAEINKILQIGADRKPIKGADKGFRNFIVSNVIESSRFHYLVRYNNPHKTRMIANNPNVVRFVLSGIPDTQIERYYKTCKDPALPYTADKSARIELLSSIIKNINYKMFEDVCQEEKIDRDNAAQNNEKAKQKARYQAIVSLYLTVMYLVTKNLVYVNARYVMAFHALERDASLYGITDLKKTKDYNKLVQMLLEDNTFTTYGYLKNRKWQKLVRENLSKSDSNSIKYFRDVAAHISVVRNVDMFIEEIGAFHSYFELYHYIVQRLIGAKHLNISGASGEYLKNVAQYHTYCKDFVKAYCIPLGYCVPRYKNLTINELFDRNHPEESHE